MPPPPVPPTDQAFGPVAVYYDSLMAGVPYQLWVDYIKRVWDFHGLAPRRVLDLACGTGTVSRLLAHRGYDMVGVDLAPAMLRAARERVDAEGLAIPFYEQDATDLDLAPPPFDAIICLFDSLNYILDPARLAQALRRVARHLGPGGSLLFDVNTEYALSEGMFNQSCSRKDEALHYRWRSRYDPEARLCTVHMRFSYDPGAGGERQTFTEVHRQRAYHKDELLQWLRDAGFTRTFVYDAYSLEPAKKRSDRLFYLALMPPEEA